MESDYNRLYLNTEVNNSTTTPLECRYKQTYTDAVLDTPGEYYLTFERFHISSQDIPLKIVETFSGISQTGWTFTLSGAADHTQEVLYVPENTYSAPNPTSFDSNNRFFWVYSIHHMLTLFNTALSTAHASLFAAQPAVGANPPFFRWISGSKYLQLIVPQTYRTNSIEFFVNDQMTDFFVGFNGSFDSTDITKYFKIYIYNDGSNSTTISSINYDLIQEYTEVFDQNIASFKSLVLTTQSLPINMEQVATPNNPNGFLPILTDFLPDVSGILPFREAISYYPDGPYRILDLKGNNPLYRVDWQVFWLDKERSELHKLYLYKNSYANIKFGLFKKSTFEH